MVLMTHSWMIVSSLPPSLPLTPSTTEESEMDPEFVKTMNAIAEGTPKDISDPTDDTTFERTSKSSVKLYRVSDASGALEITEAGAYPLSRDLLDSNVSSGSSSLPEYVAVATELYISYHV